MRVNLANTNETLEIETSTAANIDVQVGYSDITAAAIDNPGVQRTKISSATTTIILAAPAASTTRFVQYLTVFNFGTIANTIKLKTDVGGIEYIHTQAVLQVGESLRIVNDKVELLDASGRLKSQSPADSEYAGDSRSFYKVGTAPEAAGSFYCHSKDSGFPGAWSVGTPGVNGRNTDGATVADAGCTNVGIPSIGKWYLRDLSVAGSIAGQYHLVDFLWVNTGLVVTTLTAQTFTQPTLPARDNGGTSNGLGIYAGILVTAATTNAGVISNITISYTNSDGTAGRTGTMAAFPATAVVGTFVPFQMQAGDKGIRSIQSITIGTSLVTGSISLVCYNPLVCLPALLANVGSLSFPKKLDLPLENGHCLLPLWLASATTAVTLSGTVYFINK